MKHWPHRALLGLILVVCLSTFFVGSTHAQVLRPAAGCSASGCYNQDPVGKSCQYNVAFAYKYDSRGIPVYDHIHNQIVGYIQNVYSYACDSNWGEVTETSYGMTYHWVVTMDVKTVQAPAENLCYPDHNCLNDGWWNGYGGSTGWPAASDMVDGDPQVQVCAHFWHGTVSEEDGCLTQ